MKVYCVTLSLLAAAALTVAALDGSSSPGNVPSDDSIVDNLETPVESLLNDTPSDESHANKATQLEGVKFVRNKQIVEGRQLVIEYNVHNVGDEASALSCRLG